jgi:hypothetical protein
MVGLFDPDSSVPSSRTDPVEVPEPLRLCSRTSENPLKAKFAELPFHALRGIRAKRKGQDP